MAQRVLIKCGVDGRHVRTLDEFQEGWNKTEVPIELTPRRVMQDGRILAKDTNTAEYWIVWRDKRETNGHQIAMDQATEYIAEAKKNPPAHAEVFKDNTLYKSI